jgi:hypothetical protein
VCPEENAGQISTGKEVKYPSKISTSSDIGNNREKLKFHSRRN